jgi:hypothetical protein
VKLVVLQRCVLESRLAPEECAARLRGATRRMELAFAARRPFVGRVTAERFSVRLARMRSLPPRANGAFVLGPGAATEIRVEVGAALWAVRWNRRSDKLIAHLCATCEATPAQVAEAFS